MTKKFEDKLSKEWFIYVVFFFGSVIVFFGFSIASKILAGANPFALKGLIVPLSVGSLVGLLIGWGYSRIKNINLHLQKEIKKRTAELENANKQMEKEIESRKRVEQELIESEGRLQSFYGVAFEGIGITEQGKILDVNDRICEIYGFSREELIGSEVMDLVAEEDRELVLKNIKSGYDKPYVHKSIHKNGSEVIVEVHGQNIKPSVPMKVRHLPLEKLV